MTKKPIPSKSSSRRSTVSLEKQYLELLPPMSAADWAGTGNLAQPSLLEVVDSIGTVNTSFESGLEYQQVTDNAKLERRPQ